MISPSNLLRLICIQHLLWTRCGAFSGSFSKSIPLLWRTSSLIVVFDLELYSCSSASPQTRQIFISEKTAGKRVLRFNSLVRYGTCACPRGFYSRIQAGGSVAGFVVTMVKPGIGAAQCAAACRGKEPNQTLNLRFGMAVSTDTHNMLPLRFTSEKQRITKKSYTDAIEVNYILSIRCYPYSLSIRVESFTHRKDPTPFGTKFQRSFILLEV